MSRSSVGASLIAAHQLATRRQLASGRAADDAGPARTPRRRRRLVVQPLQRGPVEVGEVLAALDRLRLLLEAVPGREPARPLGVPAVDADAGAAEGPGLLDQPLEQRGAVAAAPVLGPDRQPQPGEVEVVPLGR